MKKMPIVGSATIQNTLFKVRNDFNSLTWFYGLLACIVLLGLSACAQAPKTAIKKEAPVLVFPDPPDDPRFVYERTIRTSRDVDTSVVDTTLEELLTGGQSSTKNVPLRKPYGIVVHKGRIFVSEPSARVVRVFDVPEKKFFTIGDEDPGMLAMPIGMDVDGAGNLYVADATTNAVMVYDRDGKFLRKLAAVRKDEPEMFKRLVDVAVDKKGERLYAVDIAGTMRSKDQPEFHRVRVFDAKTGSHLFDIGKRGIEPGEFNLPRDVTLDKDNNLFVVDGGNFRVQVFDSEGKFLRQFGRLGQQIGDFSRPKALSIDPSGNSYVTDAGFLNMQIFSPDGQLLMSIGSGGDDVPAHYRLLAGVAVDEDGRIYLVDQISKKIDIFRPFALGPQEGYLGGKSGNDNKTSTPAPKNEVSGEKPVSDPQREGDGEEDLSPEM